MQWQTEVCCEYIERCCTYLWSSIRHSCRVTLAENYFLSELLYSPHKDLDNISTALLVVATVVHNNEWEQATRAKRARLDDSGNDTVARREALELLAGAEHWILDIDLDFFSTANPFSGSLSKVHNLFYQ